MNSDGKPLSPGWASASLGVLGDYVNGRGFKKSEWQKIGRPIIRIQDLTCSNDKPNYFGGQVEERYIVRFGDLLISWSATLGAFIWRGPEGVLNQHIFKVTSFIDKRFHHAIVQHVLNDMRTRTHGTGMVHITKSAFDRTTVPLPPLCEQSRIADILDELFSDLEAGLAALERVREKLALYRASVLKAAVEGKLTAEWRQQHAHTAPASELLKRILVERRHRWEGEQIRKCKEKGIEPPKNWKARYKEPDAPNTANLPLLPEGWIWATIYQCGNVQLGRQRAPQHHSGDHMRPYLRVANVFEDRLDIRDVKRMNFTPEEFTTYELRYGDILLNEGQSPELVGRPAMYRDEIPGCCYQKTLLRFRAYPGVLERYALSVFRAYLHNGRFRKSASITTSIAHLAAERFILIEFPLPPLAEQEAIVEAVEDHLSVIDRLGTDFNTKLKKAQALRQSILRHAFTGQLVPQDPNDEPAIRLLKRIAAERELRAGKVTAQHNGKQSPKSRRGSKLRSTKNKTVRDH
jgi:type I restriction enzyme S subunit